MKETYKPLGVGIIGCGLIGQKRAKALGNFGKLIACADTNLTRAEALAGKDALAFSDWRLLLKCPGLEVVFISTPHNSLVEIAAGAINAELHVLLEKPAASFSSDLEHLNSIVLSKNLKVHVGFNHRYHRSIKKAKELIVSGAIGEIMFLRARYGHGGRIGYDKEWRATPSISGGGELIDQGSHLIDLSRWFLGEISEIHGFAHTYYWDMPVDDNGFMILKTIKKQVAFLHASCTEWKNLFSMEIYGKQGKIDLSGLGGSYGLEKITYYKMLPEMGPPETVSWEYPMNDNSWELENQEFFLDIRLNREPSVGIRDALATLKVVEKIYKESGYDHRA